MLMSRWEPRRAQVKAPQWRRRSNSGLLLWGKGSFEGWGLDMVLTEEDPGWLGQLWRRQQHLEPSVFVVSQIVNTLSL